jgi:predicted RNA-binding Zn ribbon-like protein
MRYAGEVADRREFRFGWGATWLDLLATTGQTFGAHPVERLDSVARLADWLARTELTPTRPPTERDLDRTCRLRETLRTLALATVRGTAPDPGAVDELAEFLHRHPDRVRLDVADRLRRQPPASTTEALARIAHQAADQLTGPARHALSICAEHDCQAVFADPAGRRRWCPAPSGASRGRVRALRARRAAAAD